MELVADAPYFTAATVIGIDPENYMLSVVFPSGQEPPLPIRVGINGAADYNSINQKQLPQIGTRGLVCFPYRDYREGIWLCSIYGQLEDAITTGADDKHAEFESFFSGAFRHLDSTGNATHWFPDGSYIQISDSDTLPTLYRHSVDDTTQVRTRDVVAPEDKVATTPPAKNIRIRHSSGTEARIDTGGNLSMSVASGKTYEVSANNTNMSIDASGNMSMSVANGETFTVNCSGVEIFIDASGKINIGVANGSEHPVLASKLLSALYYPHTHIDSMGGTTTGAVDPIAPSDIESQRISTDS